MAEDTIAEVGIDGEGRLYVRPSLMSFDHIWRAAMEVDWDAPKRRLFGPAPRTWGYADWFKQIVAAAADEYGTRLKLTPKTVWSNIPDPLRTDIQSSDDES